MTDLTTFALAVGGFGLLVCGAALLADAYAALDDWRRRRRIRRVLEQFDHYHVDEPFPGADPWS